MNRFEESRGKGVIARNEGANVGTFDDFQFDLRSWEIFGYRIKPHNVFGKAGGVSSTKLDLVGRDVAFVQAETDVEWTGGGRNSEDGRSWASSYLGTKVISRDGTSLGEVVDILFEPASRKVLAIVLNDDRIALLNDRVATGSAAVVLENAAVAFSFPAREKGETMAAWWERVNPGPSNDKIEIPQD